MSMHIKPLTPIEEAGLRAHGLPVGKPSQLADAFRLGMAWADKARAEAALSEPQPDAGLIGVQWWLAELDRYGNAKLVDGQHSGRAGADKAMYLIKALHLDAGRRYAVARVELSEPKPSGEGVNHEAIKTLNDARREAQP